MTCDDIRRRLSLLLDGESREDDDLLNHLKECAPCRDYRTKLQAADGLLAQAAQKMAPPLDEGSAHRFAAAALTAGRKPSALRRSLLVFASIAALVLIAFTAIAVVVNTDTAHPQEVVLTGGTAIEGVRGPYRVHVRDGKSLQPIAGAKVTAHLKSGGTLSKILEVATDVHGDAVVDVEPPAGSTEISLDIHVASSAGQDRITRRLSIVRPRRLYVSIDKPIYQPTHIVHVAIKAVNAFTMKPVNGEEMSVLITDPGGNKVFRQAKATSDFGIVGVDFQLADEVILGRYSLKAKLGDVETERTFEVAHYVLPQFDIVLDLNRGYYRPNEPIYGSLFVKTMAGQPVKGTVVFTGSAWEVNKFVEKFRVTGETNAEGKTSFMANTPRELFGTQQGEASLRIEAAVTNGADHTETKAVMVAVSAEHLKVLTIPDGSLVEGIENRAFVVVSKPDGTAVKATLIAPHGTFETDDSGVALIRIPSLAHAYDIDVHARDGSFLKTTFDPRGLARDQRAFALHIAEPVLRGGRSLQLETVCSFATGTIYIDIVRQGHTILTKALEVKQNRAELATELPPEAIGTVQVRAYRILADGSLERDTRLILVEPPQGLKIKITPAKAEFRPGEEIPVMIEVTDNDGKPIDVAFTLSAVDKAVFMLNESRPGLERVYLAIEEELLRPRYQLKMPGNLFDSRMTEVALTTTQPPGAEVLEAVTFAGKAEYFRERALRFNRWLANIAGISVTIVLGLAFLGLIGWSISAVRHRHGVAPAVTCGFAWFAGLTVIGVLVMIGATASKYAAADRMTAAGGAQMPGSKGAPDGSPAGGSGPRIRQFFPETLYWKAELVTGQDGKASLTLPYSDSITTYKFNASAISRSGRMGATTADLRVFQDFYVDVDLPLALTQGDVVHIPVAVHNYRGEAQTVRLEMEAPGFELRDDAKKELTIAANDVKAVYFKMRAAAFGTREITVKAIGSVEDAVRRTVEVLPDGKEIPLSASDRVLGRRAFTVTVPANAIDGASAAWVKLYPSTFSEVVTGLERLVQLPYG